MLRSIILPEGEKADLESRMGVTQNWKPFSLCPKASQ